MPQMMPLMWFLMFIFLIIIFFLINSNKVLSSPYLNKSIDNKLFHSNSPIFILSFY